ncbi:MAG: Methionyl-tRNA formyltransferase [Chlamydiia bacterium]|nr:Methionyl-tRNA formyltransferase [Chlamydiia bacterium]MCH9616544.1 Methionyl-tRNA formyltransferase [Chlamydiia bacterium]MCH9629274.1 Methionyl-tRNA formyltransferase [Chlamydiia bacterium]
MRILFFGTPQFSAHIYEYLVKEGCEIAAVVTKPDKPRGRSSKLQPPALKTVAECPVLQPEKASTPEFEKTLKEFNADLFVVVAYGEILKQNILDIPKKGCINIHASLLPKLRGAAPIQQAIIDGEKVTGITIIDMVLKMDAGDILEMASLPISDTMTGGELTEALMDLACGTVKKAIDAIADGTVKRVPQDHQEATFVKKITTKMCELDFEKSATDLHNLVRGLNPRPGAYCIYRGKRFKVLETKVVDADSTPGELVAFDKTGFIIGCGVNSLQILKLQPEGKKQMDASAYILGNPFTLTKS